MEDKGKSTINIFSTQNLDLTCLIRAITALTMISPRTKTVATAKMGEYVLIVNVIANQDIPESDAKLRFVDQRVLMVESV